MAAWPLPLDLHRAWSILHCGCQCPQISLVPFLWTEITLPHTCPPPGTATLGELLQAQADSGHGVMGSIQLRAQRSHWGTSAPSPPTISAASGSPAQDKPWAAEPGCSAPAPPPMPLPPGWRSAGAQRVLQRTGNDHDNTSGCPGAGLCCCSAC